MQEIGDQVRYVDPTGRENNALVTAYWGGPSVDNASINLVYVSPESDQTDSYGRQIARSTSVPHKSNQAAPGNYWLGMDE